MRRLLASIALAATALPAPAAAQSLEQAVKAAFLPKFARYVTWPPPARPATGEPLTLCVIGVDPFGGALDKAVAGQRIEQTPMAVRRIVGVDAAAGCHVAFVRGASAQAIAALGSRSVLTVTDSRYGGARGVIHFAMRDGRVSFHVDDALAARSRLDISSRLLSVALSVRQRG